MTLLAFLLFLLAFSACNESSDTPDGDTSPDGDSDTALDGDSSDPCLGAAVDCAPGTCFVRDGKARCDCPEDYHAERYNCVPDLTPDGDLDAADGDVTEDGDDSDGDDSDGDAGGCEDGNVPNCTGKEDECYPCKIDLPIQGPDENGLFSVDIKGKPVYGLEVWENWVVFAIYFSDVPNVAGTGGIFLLNCSELEIFKLADQSHGDLYPVIKHGKVIWAEIDYGEIQDEIDDIAYIHSFDLALKTDKVITVSESYKHTLNYFEPYPYWVDNRRRVSLHGYPINSLNAQGDEVRIDSFDTSKGAADFTVFGSTIAYSDKGGHMGIINREKGEEYFLDLPSNVYFRRKPRLWGEKLFYADNRTMYDDDQIPKECGYSLYQYNLSTNEETIIHLNTEGKDYLLEDVWEDWLLYSYYAEENFINDGGNLKYCGLRGADGNLFLRYLPTGEEWNITDNYGNQREASMWGPIVVWHDTRDDVTPTYGYGELYGTDLCQHPELKDRFAECAQREGAN